MGVDVDTINKGIRNNKAVTIFANCSIRYSGRAESFLLEGDRIIIIKPDKTLLVHQPTGSNPINWMKEGSHHQLVYDDSEGLVLKSRNLSLKEFLNIFIKRVYAAHIQELKDGQKLQLMGSERDMADMIYNNPELIEKGFKPLSQEEHTKYGFIDVFGYDKNNILTVIECKRYATDLKAIDQLRRYVEKIKSLKGLENVRGIIAAPRISPNARRMLRDFGFEFRAIKPPKYLEEFDKKQKRLGEY